ncbi:MAG: SDR family oxidoreductase [Acidobacteriia bacterium]|nr:SDR family oxidoreductase [Terriglobia bacterium]
MKKKEARTPATSESLAGKVAVVTGASRGIGLAIAKALAAKACSVVITGRSEAKLDAALKQVIGALQEEAERNRDAHAREGRPVPELDEITSSHPEFTKFQLGFYNYACDVRSEKDVRALFRFTKKEFGRVDILINNAGTAHALRNVQDMPLSIWREVLDTNLTGMFLCTRAALPLMSTGGVIVNNLSVAARSVFAGESAYCASKHGALGFTDTLREEVRGRGIRVVSLLPGPTATDMWNQFMPEAPREKMMSPDTVAHAVINAITLPEDASVEELKIGPVAGNL